MDLVQQVNETLRRLQQVQAKEEVAERTAQHVLDEALTKALSRINSGLDRFEAVLSKGLKRVETRVDALAEVVSEVPEDDSVKSFQAVLQPWMDEMRQALKELMRVAGRPLPEMPTPVTQLPVNLTPVMVKLEEIKALCAEPMMAEMEMPTEVKRGTRVYDIKKDRNGIPYQVIAKDA